MGNLEIQNARYRKKIYSFHISICQPFQILHVTFPIAKWGEGRTCENSKDVFMGWIISGSKNSLCLLGYSLQAS